MNMEGCFSTKPWKNPDPNPRAVPIYPGVSEGPYSKKTLYEATGDHLCAKFDARSGMDPRIMELTIIHSFPTKHHRDSSWCMQRAAKSPHIPK